MRCSMLATSFSAPSAVWTTEMPSCALLTAWPMPPICALMFWLITRPDASSAAELIREPDESFCKLLETAESVADRLRYASNAVTLVLTRRLMRTELLVSVPIRPWPDRPGIRARKIPIDETGTEMSEPDKDFFLRTGERPRPSGGRRSRNADATPRRRAVPCFFLGQIERP